MRQAVPRAFEALRESERALEDLLAAHQRALVAGGTSSARRLLEVYRRRVTEHMAAEERHLFPALPGEGSCTGPDTRRHVESLVRQHRVIRDLVDRALRELERVVADSQYRADHVVRVIEVGARLKRIVKAHEEREAEIVFPALERSLDVGEQKARVARALQEVERVLRLDDLEPAETDPGRDESWAGPPADDYVDMVCWKTRLDREFPFLLRRFHDHRVKRILDAACGPGYHAGLFAHWGWTVHGVDASPSMVAHAHKLGSAATFELRDIRDLKDVTGAPYDALVCLGNSIGNLLDDRDLDRFLSGARSALASGGILVFQALNHARMLMRGERLAPVTSSQHGDLEKVYVGMYDLSHRIGTLNLLVLVRENGQWQTRVHSVNVRMWQPAELLAALEQHGFEVLEWRGDFNGSPFDERESRELIGVAMRPRGAGAS